MLYVICLCILRNVFSEHFLSWEVCCIYFLFMSDSDTAPELYIHFYLFVCASYNGVWIDMFVYVIQPNYWLYFILVIVSYLSLMYGLFFHCIVVTFTFALICLWMLYLCILQYVGVIHITYSVVVLNLGNIAVHISYIWFVMPFLPSSLTCTHKSGLTYHSLN